MIYGIGTDVVEVSRIKLALKKHGQKLAEKILTAHELLAYKDVKSKENFLAKRFAAKEAFAKAFGTGLSGDVKLKSIEVINDDLGKPLLKYHDKLKVLVQEKNIHRCHLSISDEKNIAVAFVILETQ